ncbi:MAG: right-handed parallel beta-helix repeat-containing protein [candidate division KSB1 bacterium]|nr:right-handed parallel beta-helix repeat-containing protein [candidate division KSB1 bacterium]
MTYRLFCLFFICGFAVARAQGPETRAVDLTDYQQVYYVSQTNGSNQQGAGSASRPWRTLAFALQQVRDAGPSNRVAILVAAGEYAADNLQLKPYVDLYGGFGAGDWQRDLVSHPTTISGADRHRLFIGADHCRIDGFILRDGRVRGKGAAVFCNRTSPVITNNIFTSNQTLAPQGWNPKYRHEIANDGGAIYAENGAAPVIENNLFMQNSTEIGRGAAVALHGRSAGTIRNNVFLYNTTGLSDPKRSSDGGAVSVFDHSRPHIENNIFLGNRALRQNDGGALFVALWSSAVIRNNIFVGNRCDDDGGALFIGGQEHRYDRPFDKMPPAEEFWLDIAGNVIIGNANPSMNSGAMRMTMETRARFSGNVCAFNTGIYFQRSEVEIDRNVILDDFLCIETRDWLEPYRIRHNWFFGKFTLTSEAELQENWIRSRGPEGKRRKQGPGFVQDRQVLVVWHRSVNAKWGTTTLFVPGARLQKDQLRLRVVRAGDVWGVVRRNDEEFVEIWGLLPEAMEVVVLPSYRVVE